MPIRPEDRGRYPADWPSISRRIREDRAAGRCECNGQCGADHATRDGRRCAARNGQAHPVTGSKVVLTVGHLDRMPEHNAEENLLAMCQDCHLAYDAEDHVAQALWTRSLGRIAERCNHELFQPPLGHVAARRTPEPTLEHIWRLRSRLGERHGNPCRILARGNPFLDMAMLHGRFPGAKSRFCTDELKLAPMEAVKDPVRLGGTTVVEWIGERADESAARAAKPPLEREYCAVRAPVVLYRPIHALKAADTFEIAHRHGLRPNPLYLMGMSRVGCMPCIMCGKGELREIALRFPEQIERVAEWEKIAGGVARHAYSALLRGEEQTLLTSFLPTDKVPYDVHGMRRASIHRAIEWARTGRGGRNYDLLNVLDELDAAEAPDRCSSRYALCE